MKALLDQIKNAGGTAYAVGGTVRDEILGVKPKDWDIEVHGLSMDTLRAIAQKFGTVADNKVNGTVAVLKMKAFGKDIDLSLPRQEEKTGPTHKDFDVNLQERMSCEDAARRRDYTIGAIMKNLHTGEIIDPFGGRADLALRKLRIVDYETFPDDPIRPMRGAQFCARFKMTPDYDCQIACMRMTDEFDNISHDRIWTEWEKLCAAPYPSYGLTFLNETAWVYNFGALLDLMETYQDPMRHPEGDVWAHTLQTADAAARLARKDGLNRQDTVVLVLTAICHDMGKPRTTRSNNGRWESHGHASYLEPVRKFLKDIGAPHPVVNRVLTLVRHHAQYNRPTAKSVRKLSRKLGPHCTIRDLARVIIADNQGRRGSDSSQCMRCGRELTDEQSIARGCGPVCARKLGYADEWIELAERLNCADQPEQAILMGRDLLKHNMMKPGPLMGQVLQIVEHWQIDGAITNKKQALRFAQMLIDFHEDTGRFPAWILPGE